MVKSSIFEKHQNQLPIVIIGGGGHSAVVIDTIRASCSNKILGFTSLTDEKKEIYGVPYLGDDEVIQNQNPEKIFLVLGVGTVQSSKIRSQIFTKWKEKGFQFKTIIHPSVIFSSEIEICEGAQILMGAVVQVGCKIKENVILNTKCSIDHDCFIGAHSHIAPGATLSGGVCVEKNVHIGTGATVIQNIKIRENATVGAGSVVLKDVEKNQRVVGVPAR